MLRHANCSPLITILKKNVTQTSVYFQWMKKNKKSKQWKFEQNRTICSRVMNFVSFSKFLVWGSLSWQLCQHLWCHRGQLSIHFVHNFSKKLIYMKFQVRNQHNSSQNACRIDVAMSYSNNKSNKFLFFLKMKKMWNSVYKMNGELSTMTSQMLVELPTQGSP